MYFFSPLLIFAVFTRFDVRGDDLGDSAVDRAFHNFVLVQGLRVAVLYQGARFLKQTAMLFRCAPSL